MSLLRIIKPAPGSKDALGPQNGKGVENLGEVDEDGIDFPIADDGDAIEDLVGTCCPENLDDDPDLMTFQRGFNSVTHPCG